MLSEIILIFSYHIINVKLFQHNNAEKKNMRLSKAFDFIVDEVKIKT